MSFQGKHTYSAFVYENDKHYFADCVSLNLVSAGESATEAVENLQQELSKVLNGKSFKINPVFEKR